MYCAICWCEPFFVNDPLRVDAVMVINGVSVCSNVQHIRAVRNSTNLNYALAYLDDARREGR